MCRMPSPLPGPLRGEPDRELLEENGVRTKGLLDNGSSDSNAAALANTSSAAVGGNAAQAPVGRVA